MKTSILLSGQARSFAKVTPPVYREGLPNPRLEQPWARGTFLNQKWYLYRLLGEVEFFVSLADDDHAHEVEPLLLAHYPKELVHVEVVKQPRLPEPPMEATYHGAYGITAPFQSILRDLWHRQRVWEFYQGFQPSTTDTIVRLRPDIFFQTVRLARKPGPKECQTPFFAWYGGINDRFAILGSAAASAYFQAFSQLPRLLSEGCPMHPETILSESLTLGGIPRPTRLDCHFLTLRRDSEIVFQKIEESLLGYIEAGIDAVSGH